MNFRSINFLAAAAAWLVLSASVTQAGTVPSSVTVFLSDSDTFSNLNLTVPESAIGTSGAFDIWVRTNEQLSGVALNVNRSGNAVGLTGSSLVSNAETSAVRWLIRGDGTVESTSRISTIQGGAFIGLGSVGIGPDTAGADNLHDAGIDAFKFARVQYDVLRVGTSRFSLQLAPNIIGFAQSGTNADLFLGVGDGPVAIESGATGATVDGKIVVQAAPVPVPAGPGQMAPLGGGSQETGGVDIVLDVDTPGELTFEYDDAPVVEADPVQLQELADAGLDLDFLSNTSFQSWNIDFDGTLTGPVVLKLGYDGSLLTPEEEALLEIYHKGDDGIWRVLEEISQDFVNDIIEVVTPSLSPFVLGISAPPVIPEPATALLGSMMVLPLLVWRRRQV